MPEFRFNNAHDAILELREVIREDGSKVSPRGMPTLEIRNALITIENPTDVLLYGMGRKMNPALAALESLQLIGGFSDPALLMKVAPNMANFSDGGYFHGAYGPRLRGQMPKVVERLQADPLSRQAIAMVWDPMHDLYVDGVRDYPCTIYFSWAIRNGELEQTTHMRSNDLWWGWTYDVVQFTMLQNSLARFLGLPTGKYSHYVDSLHYYRRDEVALFELTPAKPEGDVPFLQGICPGNHMNSWAEMQALADDIAHYPSLYVEQDDETLQWLGKSLERFEQP